MKKYLSLFLSLYCLLESAAQDLSLSFRTVSLNEGLSQSSVVDIAVDRTGFLWFATQDGLNRYDGKNFLVFNKNFNDVTTRSRSRLGKIKVGNENVQTMQVQLYDMQGKLYLHQRINYQSQWMRLPNLLASGIYNVMIISGDLKYQQKFMKE